MKSLESIFSVYPGIEKHYYTNAMVHSCVTAWEAGHLSEREAMGLLIDKLCEYNDHLFQLADIKIRVVGTPYPPPPPQDKGPLLKLKGADPDDPYPGITHNSPGENLRHILERQEKEKLRRRFEEAQKTTGQDE